MPCGFLYVLWIFHPSWRVQSICGGISLQCTMLVCQLWCAKSSLCQINSLKQARKNSWQVYFLKNIGLHFHFIFLLSTFSQMLTKHIKYVDNLGFYHSMRQHNRRPIFICNIQDWSTGTCTWGYFPPRFLASSRKTK